MVVQILDRDVVAFVEENSDVENLGKVSLETADVTVSADYRHAYEV